MTSDFGFEIDGANDSVQNLPPPDELQRFEGIAFSSAGNIIAVASPDTNTVFLFRRKANGLFEDTPYSTLSGPKSGLDYPHDVSFSRSGGATELLAVAQRRGAIAIYEENQTNDNFGLEPVFQICGTETKLDYSDGVAFVPPLDDYLAACNLVNGSLSFYRRISRTPIRFELEPEFELKHRSLGHPDGLAFSRCGKWLAVANHGNHTVSIFQRRSGLLSGSKLRYGPRPVTVLTDPAFCHPHSLAFTPEASHLAVTNAGANHFSVYGLRRQRFRMRWSQSAVTRKTVDPERIFDEINASSKMEGGPKGLAIHNHCLAICRPRLGVKIYSFREQPLIS